MKTHNFAALAIAAFTLSPALAAPTPTQQAYFKASNAEARDVFGSSVAVSGDTAVVGARYESSNATGVNGNQTNNSASQSGAAYVFVRNGTNWIQQAYLKASNTGSDDNFGWSVAISGDTIVVGAPFEDSNATGVNGDQTNSNAADSGAAYVFVRSGTNWSQQAYLKASNTGGPSPGESVGDTFGWSVAVSGDTVVVGANGEDSNATGANGDQNSNSAIGSGAAYVFVRAGTNWSQQAYLKASNTGGQTPGESYGDAFGESAGVSGNTVVVGAHLEDSNATGVNGNQGNNSAAGSGAAYVFVRNGTNWIQQAYLKASNTGAGDEFGFAVAISGDTVVAGAAQEDSNATGVNGNQGNNSTPNSGAAYVFVREGTNWSQQAYLKTSYNASAPVGFGFSVALSVDVLVVGAPGDASNATGINGDPSNNSALDSGAAYVFTRDGTNWSQRAYLKASNTGGPLPGEFYGDNFGADRMVAVSGDTVLVGAHSEDSNGIGVNGNQTVRTAMDSGAAYVFTGFRPSFPPGRAAPAGKLIAWGNGQFGRTNVPPGDDFVAIAAPRNGGHALALRSDGSLAGWGLNYGIQELGSADIFYGQATVPLGNDFKAIAAGVFHSLALRADGSLVGWGANEVFGHGDFTGQATVPPGNDFVAIATGDFHSLALRSDGSLVAWGDNSEGSGKTNVPPGNEFVAIAAGDWHSLALKSDGSIVAWGEDRYRQVRDVPRGTNFVAITGGTKFSLALKSDGSMVGWGGAGSYGVVAATPQAGTNFVAIAAGANHSLALKSDGSMISWGSNYGVEELGSADIFYGQAVPRVGTNFIAIVAGDFFSLAIQSQLPVLTVARVGNDIILSWSTNHSGYTLEAKTDLSSLPNWSNVPGTPASIGNQFVVTNSVASENLFFRLKR
jgi:hypothetical protein